MSNDEIDYVDSMRVDLRTVRAESLSEKELMELVFALSNQDYAVLDMPRPLLETRLKQLTREHTPHERRERHENNENNENNENDDGEDAQELNGDRNGNNSDIRGVNYSDALDSGVDIAFAEIECDWSSPADDTGDYGSVYFGRLHGVKVALKVPKQKLQSGYWSTVRKEIGILKHAGRHPNVCPLLGVSRTDDGRLCIVMKRMKCDLREHMRSADRHAFSTARRVELVRDCARGLLWLHRRPAPIVHLDLKAKNLLVDESGTLSIADFGLSVLLHKAKVVRARWGTAVKGNVAHFGPEILSTMQSWGADLVFGTSADVFAFAVCAWEILSAIEWSNQFIVAELARRNFNVAGNLRDGFKQAVRDGFRPPLDRGWPRQVNELLARCWHHDPAQRPPMDEVYAAFEVDGAVERAFRVQKVERFLGNDKVAFQIGRAAFEAASSVPWLQFLQHFWRRFRRVSQQIEASHLTFLKLAVGADSADERVSIVNFSRCVDAFRPLDATFLLRVRDALLSGCFDPFLDEHECALALHGQPAGTFLLRYSSRPKTGLTLSRVAGDARISKGHQAVVRVRIFRRVAAAATTSDDDGYFCVGLKEFEDERFYALADIFDDAAMRKRLHIASPPSLFVPPGRRLALPTIVDTVTPRPSSAAAAAAASSSATRSRAASSSAHPSPATATAAAAKPSSNLSDSNPPDNLYAYFDEQLFERLLNNEDISASDAIARSIDRTRDISEGAPQKDDVVDAHRDDDEQQQRED
jgi:Protein tyrosine and serine/threonine kinase